jgi:hypothetical protein
MIVHFCFDKHIIVPTFFSSANHGLMMFSNGNYGIHEYIIHYRIRKLKVPVCSASIYKTLQLKDYYFLHLCSSHNKPAQENITSLRVQLDDVLDLNCISVLYVT